MQSANDEGDVTGREGNGVWTGNRGLALRVCIRRGATIPAVAHARLSQELSHAIAPGAHTLPPNNCRAATGNGSTGRIFQL